jgi:hypothetical protein
LVVLPYFKTDPAKLIFADAGHMYAAVVFFDGRLTHGTFLSDDFVDPLVLFAL